MSEFTEAVDKALRGGTSYEVTQLIADERDRRLADESRYVAIPSGVHDGGVTWRIALPGDHAVIESWGRRGYTLFPPIARYEAEDCGDRYWLFADEEVALDLAYLLTQARRQRRDPVSPPAAFAGGIKKS